MKIIIALFSTLITAFPLIAQSNLPVSFSVEVPSFSIEFPDTMTLGQIDDALKKCFGTNLTLTFLATNNQTHERVKFTGNSMPNRNELEGLFAWQRQRAASKITAAPEEKTNKGSVPQSSISDSASEDSTSDIEERKAAALERQADALELQTIALEEQTLAQERAADAAEDLAFKQQMLNNDINFKFDMLEIQSQTAAMTPVISLPPPLVLPFTPMQQPEHPTLITGPGFGTIVVSPAIPGQPQLITGPGLKGQIVISPAIPGQPQLITGPGLNGPIVVSP